MKRTAILLLLCLGISDVALADKTTTALLAGSAIVSLRFDLISQPGKVVAEVCGRAPLQGGGFSPVTCYLTVLTSGSIFTQVNTLASGGALTFWQQQEGL